MRNSIFKITSTAALLAISSVASANEIKGPMYPGSYLATQWKDGPVCVYRSVYKNDETGRYLSLDKTDKVAFWFGSGNRKNWFVGRNAPKFTNNGTPIEFFVSDKNNDGKIQVDELNQIPAWSFHIKHGVIVYTNKDANADAVGEEAALLSKMFLLDGGSYDLVRSVLWGYDALDPSKLSTGC